MKAFPSKTDWTTKPYSENVEEGMDLRDYFAAKILASIVNHDGPEYEDDHMAMDAKTAYKYADAMMEARNVS